MASHTEVDANYALVMDEKRKAMLNHLVGVCSHPSNTYYKSCNHSQVQRSRLDPGTLAFSLFFHLQDIGC